MKTILPLLLLFSTTIHAQLVNLPDANFKSKLLALGIDTNTDGEIQNSEAAVVINLNLTNSSISDLTGIEAFIHLTSLNCSGNNLTTIDLSALTELTNLNCAANELSVLNLDSQIGLAVLNCSGNPLNTLDLHDHAALTTVNCANDSLTSLNVNGCIALDILHVEENPMTSLDLSGSAVREFSAEVCPNLTYINLKNGIISSHDQVFPPILSFSQSNALQFICSDEGEEVYITEVLSGILVNQVSVSTYCSFVPGGSYNTIVGNATYDVLGDGCSNDNPYAYLKMTLNDGSMNGSTFTDAAGAYKFYTGAGSFDLTPDLENPAWFTASPSSSNVNFSLANQSIQNQDFCISANGTHPDAEVVSISVTPATPGQVVSYRIVYKNKGNQTLSGTVSFAFNNDFFTYQNSSPMINLLQPGLFSWDYADLKPFETRVLFLDLSLHVLPNLNVGDVLHFTTTVNPVTGDETPTDNTSVFNQTVVGPSDANQTICVEGHSITPEQANGFLHYNINFENTGTQEVANIVVKDTIDTAKFNLSSLRLMQASHPVETKITGNIVEFIFKNINLPPRNGGPIGGHGNVLFKIHPQPEVIIGDELMQDAHIYFNYNIPIVTNQERTTVAAMGNESFSDPTIGISPNPVKDFIHIQAKQQIRSVAVFDLQGKLLRSSTSNKPESACNLSELSPGVYFIKINTDRGSSVQKIIKE